MILINIKRIPLIRSPDEFINLEHVKQLCKLTSTPPSLSLSLSLTKWFKYEINMSITKISLADKLPGVENLISYWPLPPSLSLNMCCVHFTCLQCSQGRGRERVQLSSDLKPVFFIITKGTVEKFSWNTKS